MAAHGLTAHADRAPDRIRLIGLLRKTPVRGGLLFVRGAIALGAAPFPRTVFAPARPKPGADVSGRNRRPASCALDADRRTGELPTPWLCLGPFSPVCQAIVAAPLRRVKTY